MNRVSREQLLNNSTSLAQSKPYHSGSKYAVIIIPRIVFMHKYINILYYTAFGEQDLLGRLGVEGVVLLQQCASHVPEGFLGYRNIYIANILQFIVAGDVKPSDIQLYLASMPTSTLVGSPPCKLLWEVTTKHDFPHTLFLAPPVTSCLVCSPQAQNTQLSNCSHMLHARRVTASCKNYPTLHQLPSQLPL